jgi:hypothetical protein
MHGDIKNLYKILTRKSKGKRPNERPTHRWEGNIKMYKKEMGCIVSCGLYCIGPG